MGCGKTLSHIVKAKFYKQKRSRGTNHAIAEKFQVSLQVCNNPHSSQNWGVLLVKEIFPLDLTNLSNNLYIIIWHPEQVVSPPSFFCFDFCVCFLVLCISLGWVCKGHRGACTLGTLHIRCEDISVIISHIFSDKTMHHSMIELLHWFL